MTEETLFELTLKTPPAERAALLDRECAGQPELRQRVEKLLNAHNAISPTDQAPTSAEVVGSVFGRYTLEQLLGEGGMGSVWVAKQSEPVKRRVALKLIKTGMDSRQVLQRFEAERQALAVMDHPNIARVFDGGLLPDGRPFFAMELVNGLPINKFCDEAKLGTRERLELFVKVCHAVQHAHQKGIIHRDLKPANVLVTMIDGRPEPKVIDFGVAKAVGGKLHDAAETTQFGAIVGTLEYMAPEQAGYSGSDIDTRADIYALGVVLYELLIGLRPFDSKRLRHAALDEMIRIIREEEPPSLASRLSNDESLPNVAANRHTEPRRLLSLIKGELDWIVQRCLEKNRNRRYESANGLAREVQRFLADEPVEARPVSTGYRLKKFVRRNRVAVASAGMVLATLVAGITGTTIGFVRAERMWQRAEDRSRDAEKSAQRESDRADGERQANETSLSFARFLLLDLVGTAKPKGYRGGLGKDVKLKDAIDEAVGRIGLRFKGQPNAESYCRNRIAKAYLDIGELKAAETQLRLAIRTSMVDGKETMQSWISQIDLGTALLQTERVSEAEHLARNAAEQLLAHDPDPEQKHHYDAKEVLGRALEGLAKFAEAEVVYRELIEWKLRRHGPDHRNVAAAYVNYGNMLLTAGRLVECEPNLRNALRIYRAADGDHADSTLTVRNSLSILLFRQGKLDAALVETRQLLDGRRAALAADHPHTLQTQMGLALILKDMGQFDEAERLFSATLTTQIKRFGARNTMTMDTIHNIIGLQLDRGNWPEALKRAREHRTTVVEVMGVEDSFAIDSTDRLADCLIHAGLAAEAVEFAQQVVEARRKKKASPVDQGNARLTLGWALIEAKRAAEANAILAEASSLYSQGSPDPAFSAFHDALIGATAIDRKEWKTADAALRTAERRLEDLAKSKRALGSAATDERRFRAYVLKYLMQLHTAWDKPAEAEKWRAELNVLRKAIPILLEPEVKVNPR